MWGEGAEIKPPLSKGLPPPASPLEHQPGSSLNLILWVFHGNFFMKIWLNNRPLVIELTL